MLRDTLKDLLSIYGPTGRENKVADRIEELLAEENIDIRRDAMGNLICERKGSEEGKVILFSAHMDHIGLIVTDIEKEGYLRVTNVGGIGKDVYTPRHVIFGNGVEGVVTAQPVKKGDATVADLFVDIGAADREDALEMVSPGDICVFAPDCFEMGPYRIASPAMDDRCACALLLELLLSEKEPVNTIVGVFSTQEEVGMRGAMTAAYAVDPDLGVGIDVTAWGDTPETRLPAVRLGEGAAVKFMDRSMVASPAVRDALIRAAEDSGAAYQREILPFGGTDGAAIQHARAGIPAGTLSIPCRYVHSACEVIDMRDMNSALAILKAFVNMDL